MKKLLGNQVLIEEIEEKTKSGIIISRTVEMAETNIGKVFAVGTGRVTEQGVVPIEVEVGDEVMFQYGKKVVIESKVYLLVSNPETDIILII